MGKMLIRNIGILVSGDVSNPILDADAILVVDGKIEAVGSGLSAEGVNLIVDAQGTTVTPGLIDSHCHVMFGDFTPRQRMLDFLDSELHGGVTMVISAGEVHLPGRPKDRAGTKALAILAAKSFANFRPGGIKVRGGGLILEPGLTEEDFAEMAREGVKTVGEIGLGKVKKPEEAAPMVKWAKKYGMTVMMHTGGTSIPGSSIVTADQVIATDPDVVSHLNGGPTAVPPEEARKIIMDTNLTYEIVHCGNPKMILEICRLTREKNSYDRIVIGNDHPSGTGVVPLGILRVLNMISSVGEIPPEIAVCMATGNTARLHKLDSGLVEPGKSADLVIMDAPMGSVGEDALSALAAGDIPGVSKVIVDGEIKVQKSRNTPPPKRAATL